MDKVASRSRKLSADDRIDEIVEAVHELIIAERSLGFGMNDVAAGIGSSRALIYVYFESVGQIVDELCFRQLELLGQRFASAGGRGHLTSRALALSHAYFDHLIEEGPVLHFILRERNADSPLVRSISPFRAVVRSVATEASRALQFTPREALVFVELMSAIPESLASQVREAKIAKDTAEEILDRLTSDLVNDMRVRR